MTYGLRAVFTSTDLHGKYAQAEFGSEMISINHRASLELVVFLCLLKGSFYLANLMPHMIRIRNHPYCPISLRYSSNIFSDMKPLKASKGCGITSSDIETDCMDTGKTSLTPKQRINEAHLILQDSIDALQSAILRLQG